MPMASRADELCVSEITVSAAAQDLLGQTGVNAPTFVNCSRYQAFLWTGVKSGDAPISYTVRGGDARGWQWQQTGTIATNAGQWFRIVIKPALPCEWYRIEVVGATQTLHSKIVGVRG